MNFIAFDFDGTLADTQFAICEAMERSCIRNGFTYIGDEEFSQQIGKDLIDCVRDSTVENLDDENVEKILQSYKETFRFNLIEMFDGMRRVLELCNDLGDSIAIASSRHSSSLNKLITQLEIKPLINVVVAGDQVSEPKPHQEMFWEVAKELRCNPREIIMVGDSIWDIEMAKNCGAFAIGVTWGTHDEAELRGAGADVVCETPLALANHFNFAAV